MAPDDVGLLRAGTRPTEKVCLLACLVACRRFPFFLFRTAHVPVACPFSPSSHHLHAGSTPWPFPSFGGVSPGRQSRQMHIRSLLCCAKGDKFADTVTSSSDARRGVPDTMVG